MRICLPLCCTLLLVLVLAACERPFRDETDDSGRIVLGVSVDGARLGEDTSTVFVKLGRPTRTVRGGGNIRFYFDSGSSAGIELYFDINPDGSLSERSAYHLTAPYAGRTADGIGIDSRRAEVIKAVGDPFSTVRPSEGGVQDRYASKGNQLVFLYRNDRLVGLGMAGRSPIQGAAARPGAAATVTGRARAGSGGPHAGGSGNRPRDEAPVRSAGLPTPTPR
jgi:hypothetical protein